mgnify:CR=1 FL=1
MATKQYTQQMNETENKTVEYKNTLLDRYWEYQRSRYPDWRRYFERPQAQDGRPPVFLVQEAWRNVIVNPDADLKNQTALQNMIPEGEHHKWFRSLNSSQALALSVFGNLVLHNASDVLTGLTDGDGNNLFGLSPITLENFSLEHKIDFLGERRRTSLDAFLSGAQRVAIECKYTEQEFGTCRRPKLSPGEDEFQQEHCNGSYEYQAGRVERCPLTISGVRYWEFVPGLFKFGNADDHKPCPLNKNYQLVRNILAIGLQEEDTQISLEKGHVVVVYDERNPAFQKGGGAVDSYLETKSALKNPQMLRKCSWQMIIHAMRQRKVLGWLTEELAAKYGF